MNRRIGVLGCVWQKERRKEEKEEEEWDKRCSLTKKPLIPWLIYSHCNAINPFIGAESSTIISW